MDLKNRPDYVIMQVLCLINASSNPLTRTHDYFHDKYWTKCRDSQHLLGIMHTSEFKDRYPTLHCPCSLLVFVLVQTKWHLPDSCCSGLRLMICWLSQRKHVNAFKRKTMVFSLASDLFLKRNIANIFPRWHWATLFCCYTLVSYTPGYGLYYTCL